MGLQEKGRQIGSWIGTNWRSAHVIFIVLAVLFGLFFALKIPIGYTHDEAVHAFRAYQLQAGQLFTHPIQKQVVHGETIALHGGDVAQSVIDLEQLTSAGTRLQAICDENTNCHKPTPALQKEVQAVSSAAVNPEEKVPVHTWGASYYFFVSYIPAAIGMQVAELLNTSAAGMIYAARIGSVITYTVICAFALYLLRGSRAKYLVFTVALFPLSITLAAGLGVDMLLIAVSLLFFALILRAFKEGTELSQNLRILLITTAILIPLLKFPYLPLSLMVIFLPIFKTDRRGLMTRILIGLLVVAPAIAWSLHTADIMRAEAALSSAPGDMVSSSGQIHYILGHPFNLIAVLFTSVFTQNWLQYLGGVTQQGVPFPPIIYYFEIIPIAITAYFAACSFKSITRRRYTVLPIIGGALFSIGAIFMSLYISYTPIGHDIILGVQGRYIIPALPFLFFGAALCLPTRTINKKWHNNLYIYGTQLALLLICAVWYYYKVYVWA